MSDLSPVPVTMLFPHFHPVLAGAAERFRRYVPGLIHRGIQPSILTALDPVGLLPKETLDGCLEVHRIPISTNPNERDLHLYREAAKLLAQPGAAQVVQVIKADRILLPSLARMRKAGCKLVYVSTLVEPETAPSSQWKHLARKLTYRLSLGLIHRVVTGSQAMADWHARLGAPRSKIQIIPHGVNTQRFRPRQAGEGFADIHEKAGLPAGAHVTVSVGNLIPRKGMEVLVKIWPQVVAKHPDAWLVLVGALKRPTISSDAENAEINAYQKELLAAIQNTPQVVHVGEVNDVERWLRAADDYLFPSWQEGSPNALLEAMASGLPCATRRFLGFSDGELGEKEGCLDMVPEEGGQAWLHRVLAWRANPDAALEQGKKARLWLEKKYDAAQSLDAYAGLYTEAWRGKTSG